MQDFRLKPKLAKVRDSLRVEHAVQVVALVLHHAGVKSARLALDRMPALVEAVVTDRAWPWHQPETAQAQFE